MRLQWRVRALWPFGFWSGCWGWAADLAEAMAADGADALARAHATELAALPVAALAAARETSPT